MRHDKKMKLDFGSKPKLNPFKAQKHSDKLEVLDPVNWAIQLAILPITFCFLTANKIFPLHIYLFIYFFGGGGCSSLPNIKKKKINN